MLAARFFLTQEASSLQFAAVAAVAAAQMHRKAAGHRAIANGMASDGEAKQTSPPRRVSDVLEARRPHQHHTRDTKIPKCLRQRVFLSKVWKRRRGRDVWRSRSEKLLHADPSFFCFLRPVREQQRAASSEERVSNPTKRWDQPLTSPRQPTAPTTYLHTPSDGPKRWPLVSSRGTVCTVPALRGPSAATP